MEYNNNETSNGNKKDLLNNDFFKNIFNEVLGKANTSQKLNNSILKNSTNNFNFTVISRFFNLIKDIIDIASSKDSPTNTSDLYIENNNKTNKNGSLLYKNISNNYSTEIITNHIKNNSANNNHSINEIITHNINEHDKYSIKENKTNNLINQTQNNIIINKDINNYSNNSNTLILGIGLPILIFIILILIYFIKKNKKKPFSSDKKNLDEIQIKNSDLEISQKTIQNSSILNRPDPNNNLSMSDLDMKNDLNNISSRSFVN